MKKELKPYYGMVEGKETLLVSLMNFRQVYSTELKKHPLLNGANKCVDKNGKTRSRGTPRAAWFPLLGINPVGTDGSKQKCAFRYTELVAVLAALKWVADDEDETPKSQNEGEQETPTIPNQETIEDEEDNDNNEPITLEVLTALTTQIINQKLDRLLKELGIDFKPNENELIKALER